MKVRDESEIMKGKGKWLEFADEGKNGLKGLGTVPVPGAWMSLN
jgi:hypothetical protein